MLPGSVFIEILHVSEFKSKNDLTFIPASKMKNESYLSLFIKDRLNVRDLWRIIKFGNIKAWMGDKFGVIMQQICLVEVMCIIYKKSSFRPLSIINLNI